MLERLNRDILDFLHITANSLVCMWESANAKFPARDCCNVCSVQMNLVVSKHSIDGNSFESNHIAWLFLAGFSLDSIVFPLTNDYSDYQSKSM